MKTLPITLIVLILIIGHNIANAQISTIEADKPKEERGQITSTSSKGEFTDNYFEEREEFLKRWNSYTEEEKKTYSRDYKMFQRKDAFWLPRLQGGTGSIKQYNYEMNKMLSKNHSIFSPVVYTPCMNWRPIGLTSSPDFTGGLGIGRLTNVKFHNNYNSQYDSGVVPPVWDEGANTFYAASPTGGMWKSENGGADWFNLNTDFLPFLGVAEFELSKKNNSEIFIVSSMYHDDTRPHRGTTGSMALFHTLDGGLTWSSCGAPFSSDWSTYQSNEQYVGDLELYEYPTSSGLQDFVLVASELGIHKSLDHGQTWTGKLAGLGQNCAKGQVRITPDPQDNRYSYVSTSIDYPRGTGANFKWDADTIYHTSTAGEFWDVWKINKHGCATNDLSLGLPNGTDAYIARNEVLVSHTNSNVIYVVVQVYMGNVSPIPSGLCLGLQSGVDLTYLFKSTNRGGSWTRIMAKTNVVNKSHNGIFKINPQDDSKIYLLRSMATSTYNSAHFDFSAGNFVRDVVPSDMHADFRDVDLKIIRSCGIDSLFALCGTDGGLNLIKVNNGNLGTGGGNEWSNVTGTGLQVAQIYKHDASPTNSKYITFGAADIGSWVRYDYGMTDWRQSLGGDGMNCVYDYADENRFYNCDNQGNGSLNYRTPTSNPGSNAKLWTPEILWVTPLEVNPQKSSTVVAGWDWSVYKSEGYPTQGTWNRLEVLPFKPEKHVAQLGMSPVDSNLIFVSSDWQFNNQGVYASRVYRSTDGGATWNPSGSAWVRYVSGFAFDPGGQTVYTSQAGTNFWQSTGGYEKIKRSTDQGQTWHDWNANLPDVPVNCIIVDQATTEVFIGTDYGVYRRMPTDSEWTKVGCGLPNVVVTDLTIAIGPTKEKLLRASTYGRGMWEVQLSKGLSIKQ